MAIPQSTVGVRLSLTVSAMALAGAGPVTGTAASRRSNISARESTRPVVPVPGR